MYQLITPLHFIACLTLAVVAVHWRVMHSSGEDAYRFLLPTIAVATALGLILVGPFILGMLHESESMSYRMNGPYRWFYFTGFVLPLLPALGLVHFIGKRPILMAVIALLALIPVLFTPVVRLITRASDRTEQASLAARFPGMDFLASGTPPANLATTRNNPSQ